MAIFTPAGAVFAQSFDHDYTACGAQLKKHVYWLADGKQSRVNYKGLAAERAKLTQTLDAFSAFTIKLILRQHWLPRPATRGLHRRQVGRAA